MSACHGAYPFDAFWKTVWSIVVPHVPMKAVDAFLRDATPDGAVLHHTVPNKGFRVIQQTEARVVALYNHDGKYSLITANTEEFLQYDRKQHTSYADYKTPAERLPYLAV